MHSFNSFWVLRAFQLMLWSLLGVTVIAVALLGTYFVVRVCTRALEYLDTEFFRTSWLY